MNSSRYKLKIYKDTPPKISQTLPPHLKLLIIHYFIISQTLNANTPQYDKLGKWFHHFSYYKFRIAIHYSIGKWFHHFKSLLNILLSFLLVQMYTGYFLKEITMEIKGIYFLKYWFYIFYYPYVINSGIFFSNL